MVKVLVLFLFYFLILWSPLARGDDTSLKCRPNFDHGMIRNDPFSIMVSQGLSHLSWQERDFLASEIYIQYFKIHQLLGISLNPVSFDVLILKKDKLLELSEVGSAVTVDGVMNFSTGGLNSDVIRHEVFHAIVFILVSDKLPWWIEEGLAQILSGELGKGKGERPRTKTEMKYHDARLRVSRLINKCGFQAFGSYLSLIEKGNTERYAFNEIFNEECTNERP